MLYLGITWEYPWMARRILTSLSSFLISLLGYYRRMGVLRSYIPIPISLLLGSVLLG